MFITNLFLRFFQAFVSSFSIFRRDKARLLKHFELKPDVRLQLVSDIVNGQIEPASTLSAFELVAVFSLQWEQPIDTLVEKMAHFAHRSWSRQYTEDFFSALGQTIREFYIKGFNDEAASLLAFAEAAARNHGAQKWINHFHQQRESRIRSHIRNMPRH